MVDDEYESLGTLQPAGFARGLLIGIDAGMGVRATERPQTIAAWRSILTQTLVGDGVTVVSRRTSYPEAAPTVAPAAPATAEPPPKVHTTGAAPRTKTAIWIGALAGALLATGGGAYLALGPWRTGSAPVVVDAATERARIEQDVQRARGALATAEQAAKRETEEDARRAAEAEAKRKTDQAAVDKARTQEEARLKAAAVTDQQRLEAEAAGKKMDADAQSRRQAEEAETKRTADADAAETARRQAEEENVRLKAEAETRQKADGEAAARRKAEDEPQQEAATAAKANADTKRKADDQDRKGAEAAEAALRLAPADRQHVQVALTALGFNTNGTDGVLGPHSREMIVAWQKARNQPATGFLTGAQNQALLKETAPAISKYDADQKKVEEDKKTADEARRKADEDAKAKAAITPPATIAAPSSASRASDGTASGGVATGQTPSPFIGEWLFIDAQKRPVTIIIDRVDAQFAYGQMKNPSPYKNQTLGSKMYNTSSEASITGDTLHIRGSGFTTDLTLQGGALVGPLLLGGTQMGQWTFKKVR
jgi:peptidoglycan hydrolase-like protein with peptidoglycan-binding domain